MLIINMTPAQEIAITGVLETFADADVSLALNGRPGVWLAIAAWHSIVLVGVEEDGSLTSRDTGETLMYSNIHAMLDPTQ